MNKVQSSTKPVASLKKNKFNSNNIIEQVERNLKSLYVHIILCLLLRMTSYEESWDDNDSVQASINPIDHGTNFGRGRGFLPFEGIWDNDSHKISFKNDDGMSQDADESVKYKENKNKSRRYSNFKGHDFVRGRGGNKGGRGHGRGRGGGSGVGRRNEKEAFLHNHFIHGERNETGRGGHPKNGTDNKSRRGKENFDGSEKPRELYIPPDPIEDENVMFTGGISTGTNFNKYDIIQVKVTGENVPKAIEKFETSGLRQLLLNNISKSGYERPTPVQKNAIPIIMERRDLMACAQTGSGKTAAFLLPIIHVLLKDPKELVVTERHSEPQAIIISPTRELTLQIFNEARKFAHGSDIKTVVAYGGVSSSYQAQHAMKGCHILVATPGRLLDFVDKGHYTFSSLRLLVLDEADRMLDMGFMPAVERMMKHATMVKNNERQTLMFSATFPEEIQRLAGKYLNNYLFLAVGIVGSACSDVEQLFHLVPKFDKRPKLIELINREGGEKTLVFVEKKRTADFIAAYLSEKDFPTTSIHGDRMQREREEALADFKNGLMGVLVATAVAARGLDIKNVNHVINYDLPNSIDEYVHRIGRTGRVGNRGRATSFYDPETDAPLARDLVKILQQAEQEIPSWLEEDALNNTNTSSYIRPGRFAGKDVRKFDKQEGGSDIMSEEIVNSNSVPQNSMEQEEEW